MNKVNEVRETNGTNRNRERELVPIVPYLSITKWKNEVNERTERTQRTISERGWVRWCVHSRCSFTSLTHFFLLLIRLVHDKRVNKSEEREKEWGEDLERSGNQRKGPNGNRLEQSSSERSPSSHRFLRVFHWVSFSSLSSFLTSFNDGQMKR